MGYKIVRDRQQEWAVKHGVSGRWRVAENPVRSLARKLIEESAEYMENHDPAELLDLYDVLSALIHLHDGPELDAAYERHALKVKQLGLFSDHIEWSPVPLESADAELS